jgi:hypothetical protein
MTLSIVMPQLPITAAGWGIRTDVEAEKKILRLVKLPLTDTRGSLLKLNDE